MAKLEEFGFSRSRCDKKGLYPDKHVEDHMPKKQLTLLKKLRTIREDGE